MEFNKEQEQALSNLFEKFYDVSFKVILMAKTAKMAIGVQEHSNMTIDNLEIEEIFRNIEKEMQYIFNESAEMSTVPNYLFWEKEKIS